MSMENAELNKEQGITNGDLVIEENTIYEIDHECISCLERGKKNS